MSNRTNAHLIALAIVGILAVAGVFAGGRSEAATTARLTIYMQMGGTQGDPSTLARTNGAKAAAAAYGVKLIEQYSGWDPQKMIDQFKQAMAASPDGIVIMGHPGEAAFALLVDQAVSQGIIVTSGNNPLPTIEAKYQDRGVRLRRRGPVRGRLPDRPEHGQGRTEEGRQGPRVRHLAPGRAQQERPGRVRRAGGRRAQGGQARRDQRRGHRGLPRHPHPDRLSADAIAI